MCKHSIFYRDSVCQTDIRFPGQPAKPAPGHMLFLMLNQQCQSTERNPPLLWTVWEWLNVSCHILAWYVKHKIICHILVFWNQTSRQNCSEVIVNTAIKHRWCLNYCYFPPVCRYILEKKQGNDIVTIDNGMLIGSGMWSVGPVTRVIQLFSFHSIINGTSVFARLSWLPINLSYCIILYSVSYQTAMILALESHHIG